MGRLFGTASLAAEAGLIWWLFFGTAEAVPFPVMNVKGDGVSVPHDQNQRQRQGQWAGAPALHSLREFQAVGLVEQVPGFAVGGAGVGLAVAFRA